MPCYDFHCECGNSCISVVRKVAERNDPLECPVCGDGMRRQEIYRPMVAPDYEGYQSPATGKWVEGRKAHQDDLRRSGCRILEPGETESFIKNKKSREEDFGRRVEAIVEQTAAEIGMI